jgi:transposase, IS6 family
MVLPVRHQLPRSRTDDDRARRGAVDHTTVFRWVQAYAPELEKRLRWHWRRPRSLSWRVDETYVKVRGAWAYLYRALDKQGNTIDFYLSPTRTAKAAKRFLAKALNGLKAWEQPEVINTDKAPAYAVAIAELKAEGKCPRDTRHRQVKYLNNIIENDHGKLEAVRSAPCAVSSRSRRPMRRSRASRWCERSARDRPHSSTSPAASAAKRVAERAFGLGPCALAEASELIGERLKSA